MMYNNIGLTCRETLPLRFHSLHCKFFYTFFQVKTLQFATAVPSPIQKEEFLPFAHDLQLRTFRLCVQRIVMLQNWDFLSVHSKNPRIIREFSQCTVLVHTIPGKKFIFIYVTIFSNNFCKILLNAKNDIPNVIQTISYQYT